MTETSNTTPALLVALSPKAAELKKKLDIFVQERCIPAETEYDQHMASRNGPDRWTADAVPPCMERLKAEAKRLGLWNMFLPHRLPDEMADLGPSVYLTTREYGVLAEVTGRSFLAPEACNCSAPDTGNMEVLLKFGTPHQQQTYLRPLLEGTIRSSFLMTEPQVASSDATNLQTTLTKRVDPTTGKITYRLHGRKWWSTGAMHPSCRVALVVAKMNNDDQTEQSGDTASTTSSGLGKSAKKSRHKSQTVVLLPMDSPGVRLVRPLTVFGYDDAPFGHAEVALDNVLLDETNLILGEGRGFEVSQARLGPGRIHHCMRAVGMAARCYELMLERSMVRSTFGRRLFEHGGFQEMVADSATDIEAARLLTLSCAAAMDEKGAQSARDKIASVKVAVPEMTHRVVDRAVQAFGGAGLSDDLPLARLLSGLRSLRIADGPSEVHKRTLALLEIRRAASRLQHSRL